MLDQRLHRRVVAVEFAQLDRQAFAQRCARRRRADRISATPRAPPRRRRRSAEPLGGLAEIRRQIAGLIDQVDQVLADHALRGRRRRPPPIARRDDRRASLRRRQRLRDCSCRRWRRRRPIRYRRSAPHPARCARRLRRAPRKTRCRAAVSRVCSISARLPSSRFIHSSWTGSKLAGGAGSRRIRRRTPRQSRFRKARPARRRLAGHRRSGPSLARSSSGFRSSSSSTKADRSRFESCSSLIACISCGVITSDCDWRNSNLCVSAMEARTDPQKLVRFLLKLVAKPMYTA